MEWSLQNHTLPTTGITTRPLGLLTVRGRNTRRPHTTPVAVELTPEAGGEVLRDAVARDSINDRRQL